MATAAPHVKLLRQLASAKDDYLSGAFDISWDGAKATLYLVFGRPSHAVFDTDQAQIEGEAAIDALLAELPRTFAVSDWRRAMSPHETLSISIDELAGPFVRLAGSYADDPVSEEEPEWWSAEDSSPDLAFGLSDFPLLPGGRPLWVETSPENVNLAERLAELPPSILILTGAKLRAAAVVSGGDLIDAVWIDDEDQARGEAAGMALLGATKGTLAGYALDDPRVAEALTMLWRLPLAVSGIEMSWLDPASMLAAFRADGLDRVLVIDAPVRGIALFSRGGLVAVYSETQRSAVASPERLRSLLSQARGRLTVMERKPRPVAATAAHTAPSATDFFGILAPEAPAEAPPEAETHPEDVNHVAAGDPADVAAAAETDAAASADAAPSAEAPVETDAAAPTYAAWQPDAAPKTDAGVEADASTDTAADTAHDTDALAKSASDTTTAESASDTTAQVVEAEHAGPTAEQAVDADHAEPTAEQAPDAASADEQASEPAVDTDVAATSSHPEFETFSTEAAGDGSELPPPPPPDAEHAAPPSEADFAASAEHAPPPPTPDIEAVPEARTKRHWWSRGGSRKNKGAANPTPETIAAQAVAAQEAAEAAKFAGWSVRQPNPEPQPVWQRARDYADGSGDAPEGTNAPPPAAEAVADAPTADAETATDAPAVDAEAVADAPAADTDAAAPAPTWSVIEPGTAAYRTPSEPSAPPAEADDGHAATEPETAASQGWSARDVLADSVGWYQPGESAHAGETHEGSPDETPAVAAEGSPGATDEAAHEAHEADGDAAPHADAEEPDEHEVAAESGHAALDWYHPQPVAATEPEAPADEHEPVSADEHEQAAADDHEPVAADEHEPVADHEHEPAADTEAEPVAASGDKPAEVAEHDSPAQAEPAHDFWAEFASPDPDADATTAADTEAGADESATDSDAEPAAAPGTGPDLFTRRPSERTVAPWSWPLAESEPAARAPHSSPEPAEETPEPATASAQSETESEDWAPVFEGAAEQSFFQRDEPIGSQFVDFDEVRTELVQIGVVWLGEANAVPVTALLRKTRSTIDDFVATIDTIRGLHLEGQDPASIQAMAREMHQQAAERLCGA